MTKKRYQKLLRAYMTRLHESAKGTYLGSKLNMGSIYKTIENNPRPLKGTRAEWWAEYSKLATSTNTLYGVGVKTK